MCRFFHAITRDGRYIFILGSISKSYTDYLNSMFILDLDTMKWSQSEIKIPFKGSCDAIIMSHTYKSDLYVYG